MSCVYKRIMLNIYKQIMSGHYKLFMPNIEKAAAKSGAGLAIASAPTAGSQERGTCAVEVAEDHSTSVLVRFARFEHGREISFQFVEGRPNALGFRRL